MSLKERILKKKHYAVLFLGLIISTCLWVQVNINAHLPMDTHIYLDAGYKALNNQNPYQPFEIGSSFIYPPTALLLFGPLSKASHPYEVWLAINIISFILAIIFTFKASTNQVGNPGWKLLAIGSLFYAPFWEQITIGQVNSLVLLGIVVFIFGITNPRHSWIGDLGLAAAISIKISPIILVAYPLLRGDWQRLIRISLSLLILITLSILFFGAPPWFDFLKILPEIAKGYPGMNNETIDTLSKWLAGNAPVWTRPVFSIIVLVSWLAALIRFRNNTNETEILNFGIVSMTISSSLIWYHHLVFLLVPIAHLLRFTKNEGRLGYTILLFTLFGAVLINSNRIFEYWLVIPPIAAITGYLMIYLASALRVCK
jgi:hypothetical protein